MYYEDKLETLQHLFGVTDVALKPEGLRVSDKTYPIIQDVIILSPPEHHTPFVREKVRRGVSPWTGDRTELFDAIQYSFGEEWTRYHEILPEHRQEFGQYFDLVNLYELAHGRVCDLGCGNGRWSYFMKDLCRELVLVDFSDAIFVARQNLSGARNCLFFMGDLRNLPFQDDFCDFMFCAGVLHHLPTPCLEEVRRLRRFAPRLLVFLYYALDNRPAYFRSLLSLVTIMRRNLCRIRSPGFRKVWSVLGALSVYKPLVWLGTLLGPFRLQSFVPLYDFYHDKSFRRLEQDVYDRFFTAIEQRVSRNDILQLRDSFSQVSVSQHPPYWHFLCVR